ncbi:MAG: aldo/keto reductase [Candidatus Kariarchaeaceae archaeon]|jgi:aryl-alcohol dehydrogenase-like predicted oxidoreductase
MKRKLGGSDIEITPIGLGVWQFSEAQGFHKYFWDGIDVETRDDIVRTSVDGGVNWFDTAEVYGSGRSERGLAGSLSALNYEDPDVLVATKWSPFFRFARSIGKTFPKRESNLAPYPITLHQVHNPASFSSPSKEMEEMAKLLDTGKVRSVGVSNFSVKGQRKAFERLEELGHPMVSNQVKYSILDRRIENKLLPAAKELGVTIIAYSPVEQGLATGRFHDSPGSLSSVPSIRRRVMKRKLTKSQPVIDLMRDIAETHQVTVSQVALNWLINFHGVSVVAIPGASKPHHAEQNAGAMHFELSKEQLNALDDVSQVFL